MTGETYSEQLKQLELHSVSSNSEVELMTSYGEANKILPQSAITWSIIIASISSCWKGNYRNMFSDIVPYAEKQYMNLDGTTRKQAIKMKGEGVREAEKKKGFMGLFSGDE